MTIDEAWEHQQHLSEARKALCCSLLKIRRHKSFAKPASVIASALVEVDEATKMIREYITDNT